MNSKKIDCLLLIVYCGFIYWLSSRQTLPAPMWFEHQDKLYHAGAYGLMGVLAWRCFRHVITSPIILALLSMTFCSLYGLSDEWHQSFVPARDSSIEDWLADTIGAIFGATIGVTILAKRSQNVAEETHEMAMTNCAVDCANCAFHDQHDIITPNSKT
ncbi:MAG: VanZ family protein [Methylococcaceae bacterium]|nr:VanZ family protein [Methylococcaceae bacterium]